MRRSILLLDKLRRMLRAPPRGLAAVEFGLAAPILILLLVALVDLGIGFYDSLQVRGAASAGAEYATIHAWNSTSTSPSIQSAATNAGTCIGGTLQANSPAPFQVCACPNPSSGIATNLKNAIDGQTVSATTGTTQAPGATSTALGSCNVPTAYTCTGCTTSKGTVCSAGLYAVVVATCNYSPMLPYPWAKSPVALSTVATRRLQ